MSTNETIGYINAGGRGTRLNGLFTPSKEKGIAKALLEIGTPNIKLIDHHINNLRQQNIERVVVAAGDQTEVYEYINDVYTDDSAMFVTQSEHQMGNGGDLVNYARNFNTNAPLVVQNVDTILDIDLNEFSEQFRSRQKLGGTAAIALTLNRGVPNEDAFVVVENGKIVHSTEFTDRRAGEVAERMVYRGSSTGAVTIDTDFLRNQEWNERAGQLSLYKDCLRNSWEQGGLYAYNNRNRFFRDVGTVPSWLTSQNDIELQDKLRYT